MNKTFASLSLGVAITALGPVAGTTVLAGQGGYGGNGAVPGIARNYVVRLQERVKKADEAALRGSQLMADGDYQGAIDQYRAALDLLPDAPITEPRRRAYIKQFARASVLLARERADEGRYPEALALVEEVLQPSIDPDNIDAKRLLEQLNDPDYYSPALTPQHLERVRRVKLALKTAQGYTDLGDYDRADREYHKALNIDPYNQAARRGQEEAERFRMDYYDVAYDHTRAKMLRQVAAGWESPVPANIDSSSNISIPTDSSTTDIRRIEEKLKTIILPSVEFADTPLVDALEFLQQRSVELDVQEQDIAKKGVNIILDAGIGGGGGGGAAPAAPGGDSGGFGFEGGSGGGGAAVSSGGGGYADARITLRLANVPLAEALRYTTSLAQLKYKVEPHAVVVIPISTPDQDLFTNVYVVPPTFLSTGDGGGGGGGGAPADPFATTVETGGGVLEGRPTAKKILENAGINFPAGSSAIYNPTTSQLIVRNTQDQMELVEAYIESIQQGVEKQIYITSRFVEISEEDGEELGFDWLLGPFNLGTTPRVFASGGTQGNVTNPSIPQDFAFVNPLTQQPIGFNNVTAGLRSGSQAIDGNTIDALIAEAAGTSDTIGSAMAPAVFGIAGVFTDPQFQVMIRALSQRKGVDLLSAPSVMARSGQRAKIEVIREFIYPTEYDPPEIPNQFGSLLGGGGSTGGTFPVTPATPTAFETRNTGVTLEVDPVLGADEFTIDLNLAPEVVEFDGFINYGSPIQTTTTNLLTGLSEPVVITENRIEMPVFNTRKVTTQVTIWDGQTVALGGLIREDIQDIEDKIPFFGDLPAVGRLFRSSVELHLKRNLTIFVKAQLMDPAGMPINGRIEEETRPEPVPRPPITTPTTFAPGPIPYQK